MGKELTENDRNMAADMLARARAAMAEIEDWDQDRLDRLSQAIAWYAGNEKTFTRLAQQGVDVDLVVVDDGSGDGTPALLRALSARHRSLRVLPGSQAAP